MEGLELDVGLENLEELGIVDSGTVEGDPGHAPRRREFRTTYMSEEEEAELREKRRFFQNPKFQLYSNCVLK